ncbi:MAG: SDR family oxidoreductase [Pleurocapsa sp.]
MKITIIGCGYVGSAIAWQWKQQGHQVTVTTTTAEKVPYLQTISSEVAIANGGDLDTLKQVIKDREIILLSLAAKQRTVEGYRQSYLATAKNLMRAMEDTPSVQQVIYTGSYGILGNKNGAWTDETAPVEPINELGEILAQTEEVLLSKPELKSKVSILRLSGIYGPKRELIKIFRSRAGTTRPGDGQDYTNWIHLDDIVNGIEFTRQKQLSGIYNLNSDEILSTDEFFTRLFTTHNLPAITWDSSQPSLRHYNLKLDNQKLKAAGFKLVHPQIIF